MKYREIKKFNIKPSLLGFGCMRFPLLEDGNINEELSEKMIDYAISKGVTYIDTAYPYHNGDSEPFVGRVLSKYPRDSYYLATKLPMWKVEKLSDVKEIFDEQLKRLNKDYIDFYLLHALSKERFELVKRLGIFECLKKMKEAGKIKYIGFSFHDSYEVFEEIITTYPWDFCQIQLNYMDTLEQAGLKGYELTEKMGIPLIVMEPIKGGTLSNLPRDVSKIFTDYHPEVSVSSWALRWVANLPNVKVILSGMSTYEQVEDNIKTFTDIKPLTSEENSCIEQVVKTLRSRTMNGCTACRYCMPCPEGVDIPRNFFIWNNYHRYESLGYISYAYKNIKMADGLANKCIKCGKCEKLCPQKISIRHDLEEVTKDIIAKMEDE